MTRPGLRALLLGVGVLLVAGGVVVARPPTGVAALDPARRGSLRIEDRDGRLLRDVAVGGDRGRWVALEELPPWVPAAFLAAEDRRFFRHPGVDPLALARAALANRRAGRVVSGGSTVTMQLARLLAGGGEERTVGAKLREVIDALRLEARLSKREILEHYLNRVALGRGAVGVEAAAQLWFGHPARTLSPGEAAWLAVLPRAPSLYGRPEFRERLEARRLPILRHLVRRQTIDAGLAAQARAHPPAPIDRRGAPFHAPHWTEWLLAESAPLLAHRAGTLRTTLDLPLQRELEARLRTGMARLSERGATQAAVVVLHTQSGEIHALVGSADFFDSAGGQVNGALALRQAGSTLKPFTYALAFESGLTPASIVRDEPTAFAAAGGPFIPRNYGGEHFGPVRLRTALGSSLNMPAVGLLERVGAERLGARLFALGLARDAVEEAGLGLTLGVTGVRLVDLVNAYAALARGGVARPFTVVTSARTAGGETIPLAPAPPPVRLLDPLAAWWVTDILGDDAARRLTFGADGVLDMPWPVAVKTGTSSDWRDNWAIGTTREWTVGVWVGDFGGRPMERVSGVFGAAPLLRDFFGVLAARGPLTAPEPPPGVVDVRFCATSGDPAGASCPGVTVEKWPSARRLPRGCRLHDGEVALRARAGPTLRIERPTEGDIYFVDPALPAGTQVLRFAADDDSGAPLEWWVDGRAYARTPAPGTIDWPLHAGRHHLEVRCGSRKAVRHFHVVGSGGAAGPAVQHPGITASSVTGR